MSVYKFEYVTEPSVLDRVVEEVRQAKAVALDLETTGLDPLVDRIRICSINTGKTVYVLDVFKLGDSVRVLTDALHNPLKETKDRPIIVGHNVKFDFKFLLHHYGTVLWPLFDTFRASSLVYNGKKEARSKASTSLIDTRDMSVFSPDEDEGGYYRHDLYSVYRREMGLAPRVSDMGRAGWWQNDLSERHLDYAAEDVTYLLQLRDILRKKIVDNGLTGVALIEFRAIQPEAEMELRGLRLNWDKWSLLAQQNKQSAAAVQQSLLQQLPSTQQSFFGAAINLSSPDQLLKSLHRMGIPIEDTTNASLVLLSDDYPVLREIVEWRKFEKRATAFGTDYLKYKHPLTGRLHASYFPFTGTGRYSCRNPNLQQVPNGKDYRCCFEADEDFVLIVADYSQIELRIMAQLSRDPLLLQIYRDGIDAHSKTASIVLQKLLENVSKQDRQRAKPVNFGLIYGMRAKKLKTYAKVSYNVDLTLHESEVFRDRFFDSYHGVKAFHDRVIDLDRPTGLIRSLGGRIRYLDPVDDYNAWFNTPDQATGADGLKNALGMISDALRPFGEDARVVHDVHDEILLEVRNRPPLIEHCSRLLEQCMINGMQPYLPDVSVVVEAGHGPNWAVAKQ